jgi:hypothetical protein
MEHWVHWSLLGGLLVGGVLMGVGLAVTLAEGSQRPEGSPPGVGRLIGEALRGEGVAFLDLGLLALMATPVVRVGVLALGWGIERSWPMLAVALTVLALLGVRVALGVG